MYKESTDGKTWCEWKKAFGLTAPQGAYWKDELHFFNFSSQIDRAQHIVEKDGKWVNQGNLSKDVSPNFSLCNDDEHLAFAWRANGAKGNLSLAIYDGKDLKYCMRTDQKVIGTPSIVQAGGKIWLFAAIPVEEGLVSSVLC
ncbi:hypothetical protein N7490_006148 [Penicillium lividum]|nr:hypothetical protein N7490_006148 [Penicillium lividum]